MNEDKYVVEAIIRAIDDGFKKTMEGNVRTMEKFETQSGRTASRVSTDMMAVGTSLTVGVTRPIVGMFKASVNSGLEFDGQMKMTQSVLGETTKEMKKLEDQALKIGGKGLFNATEIGTIQEELASAGFEVNDILNATEAAANIAALSASKDTGMAATNLGVAITSYNMAAKDATKISDIYVASTAKTAAGVEDMGSAINYAGATAYTSGLSFEETAAAIGLLANNGQKGSKAGTTLRNILTRVTSPSRKAATALENLGVEAFDAEGKMVPLYKIIGQIETASKNLTQEELSKNVSDAFGAQAMSGVLSLVREGPEAMQKLTKEFENVGGAAQEKADTLTEGVAGQMKTFQSSMYSAQIEFAKAIEPSLILLLKFGTKVLNMFSGLDDGSQMIIATILGVIALVGPFILAIGSITKLVLSLKAINTYLQTAKLAAGVVSTASTALSAATATTTVGTAGVSMAGAATGSGGIAGLLALIPVWGWIVLAIGAVVTALVILYNKSDWFKGHIDNLWNGIKNTFSTGSEYMATFFRNLIPNMVQGFVSGKELLSTTMQSIFDIITFKNSEEGTAGDAFGTILTNIVTQYDGLREHLQQNLISLGAPIANLWQSTTEFFDVLGQVSGIMIEDMLASLNATLGPTEQIVGVFFTDMGESAKKYGGAAYTSVSTFITNSFGAIGGWFTQLGNNINGVFIGVLNSTGYYIDEFMSLGSNIIKGLSNGITSGAIWAINAITGVIDSMKDKLVTKFDIHSPSRYMEDMIGTNLMLGLSSGITNNGSEAVNALQGVSNDLSLVNFESRIPSLDTDLTGKYDAYVKSDISNSVNSRQAAYINLNLGNREYNTFVDDITRVQDKKTNLQGAYI